MSLVLDSSMCLSWCFDDERPAIATTVLEKVGEEGALVPALWHLEVANALQTAVRRGRITTAFRDEVLTELAALSITVDAETHRHAWRSTMGLADRFQLTTYDAAYLELAYRTRLPLATLDDALLDAGSHLGVKMIRG